MSDAVICTLAADLQAAADRAVAAEANEQLRGKNLACWCKPGTPCHADVPPKVLNDG